MEKDYQKLYEAQTEHVVFQIGIQNKYREQRDELANALRRSLSWLSSYPGGNAMGAYDQARAAIDKLDAV